MSIPLDTTTVVTRRVDSRLLPARSGHFTLHTSAQGWTGRLLARRLGLSTARSGHATGSLEIDAGVRSEQWTRTFGTRTWRSSLAAGQGDSIEECAGPVRLRFAVQVDERSITHMTLHSIRLRTIPTPLARWVRISGRIGPDDTTTVTIQVPGGRCSYIAVHLADDARTVEVAR